MIDSETLRHIVSKYELEQEKITSFLADGNAKTYEQYRELCGQLRGLDIAITVISDLAKSLEDNDD